jgi:hypothetical protein
MRLLLTFPTARQLKLVVWLACIMAWSSLYAFEDNYWLAQPLTTSKFTCKCSGHDFLNIFVRVQAEKIWFHETRDLKGQSHKCRNGIRSQIFRFRVQSGSIATGKAEGQISIKQEDLGYVPEDCPEEAYNFTSEVRQEARAIKFEVQNCRTDGSMKNLSLFTEQGFFDNKMNGRIEFVGGQSETCKFDKKSEMRFLYGLFPRNFKIGQYQIHNAKVVNLRSAPNQRGKIIARLKVGQIVTLIGVEKKLDRVGNEISPWVNVQFEDFNGFVFGAYLSAIE